MGEKTHVFFTTIFFHLHKDTHNPNGLDVEAVKAHMNKFGTLASFPDAETISRSHEDIRGSETCIMTGLLILSIGDEESGNDVMCRWIWKISGHILPHS